MVSGNLQLSSWTPLPDGEVDKDDSAGAFWKFWVDFLCR